jgi:hypothetical protein
MMGRPSVTLIPLPNVAYFSAVRPWSIHGEHGIALGENGWRKHRVSRIGAGQMHALGAQLIENRRNDLDFFHTEITTFAGMRIEAGNEDARLG